MVHVCAYQAHAQNLAAQGKPIIPLEGAELQVVPVAGLPGATQVGHQTPTHASSSSLVSHPLTSKHDPYVLFLEPSVTNL